jgi:pyruvate dehydrogenase E2 component (dihydrolipoamide acetyltransferase)
MSVSVSMPQLGESVTEGTVTRWLKKEGERVEADEPLLEVSTDKVDTEIPSPVSGILRGITVAEDETVAVGAELAVIDEAGDGAGAAGTAEAAPAQAPAVAPEYEQPPAAQEYAPTQPAAAPAPGYEPAGQPGGYAPSSLFTPAPQAEQAAPPAQQVPVAETAPPPAPPVEQPPPPAPPVEQAAPPVQEAPPPAPPVEQAPPPVQEAPLAEAAAPAPVEPEPPAAPPAEAAPPPAPVVEQAPAAVPSPDGAQAAPEAPPAPAADFAPPAPAAPSEAAPAPVAPAEQAPPAGVAEIPPLTSAEGPYVTPLVRKLAAEHGVDLATVNGTGVGGRIRKQDVLEAARAARESAPAAAPAAPEPPAAPPPAAPAAAAAPPAAPPAAAPPAAAAAPAAAPPATAPLVTPGPAAGTPAAASAPAAARDVVPSTLRGTTERMSRARQLIARRMVESLQTSAQLTTVVEADVTLIARLRDRAKADFEAREGVRLSFLPFFALATVEALKTHPKLNAVIDTEAGQVTYHDAEHLGIAVDTERGLMVPVVQNAGDLNIGGLARKIADLAARTRAGQVSPDDLAGGTFTLTNTGSRGALFDTPIINQPQVAILGTGSVVKRPVVVEDPQLGEVITVRSMVYLALTYDHRLVDGADAARFLATVKDRLEEGEFEAELGL